MGYEIDKTFRFESAHRLTGLPEGHKCLRLHGHSFVATVALGSETLDETGMVTDFGDLAPLADYIESNLDHDYLNDIRIIGDDGEDGGPLLPQPTSENLARHLYEVAMKVLPDQVASKVLSVRVAETCTCSAIYRRPEVAR